MLCIYPNINAQKDKSYRFSTKSYLRHPSDKATHEGQAVEEVQEYLEEKADIVEAVEAQAVKPDIVVDM